MILESNDVQKIYYFSVELYTLEDIKLKSNVLSFSVEVNEDIEDDVLNEEFKDYPKIINYRCINYRKNENKGDSQFCNALEKKKRKK